jgi:hypothetical protein
MLAHVAEANRRDLVAVRVIGAVRVAGMVAHGDLSSKKPIGPAGGFIVGRVGAVNGIPTQRAQADKASSQQNTGDTLHIQDFGDEAWLSFDQRVPWKVALEILRLLKAPGHAPEGDDLLRRLHSRRQRERPAERSKEGQAA